MTGSPSAKDLTLPGAVISVTLHTAFAWAPSHKRPRTNAFGPYAENEIWSLLPMEQQATELTTGGWVFLIIAWTVITGLTAACFYRVRKLK